MARRYISKWQQALAAELSPSQIKRGLKVDVLHRDYERDSTYKTERQIKGANLTLNTIKRAINEIELYGRIVSGTQRTKRELKNFYIRQNYGYLRQAGANISTAKRFAPQAPQKVGQVISDYNNYVEEVAAFHDRPADYVRSGFMESDYIYEDWDDILDAEEYTSEES